MKTLIILKVVLSVLLYPSLSFSTVSDFQYLEAQIKMTEEEEAPTFDEIRDYFSQNQFFQIDCYSDEALSGPNNLLSLLESGTSIMDRLVKINLSSTKFGYDLTLSFLNELPLPFYKYTDNLTCLASDFGCAALSIEREWTLNENLGDSARDPIELSESWKLIFGLDGFLYAKSQFSLQSRKRNWINAPVGTDTLQMNYNCRLEPLNEDSPLLDSIDNNQN